MRAIFVQPALENSIPGIGMAASPGSFEQLLDAAREMSGQAARSAKQSLATGAEHAKVRIVGNAGRPAGGTARFVSERGPLADCLVREARVCDLFVLPPLEGSDAGLHDIFADLLLKIGRPLLLSPRQAPDRIGQCVSVAWDNSLPAGHALSAALPFLCRAKSVEVISIQNEYEAQEMLEPAKEYLSLHGIACTERVIEQRSLPVGDIILKRAAENGCDLLVVGGYGHGRVREAIFGGVTERLTSHATIPLLMMH
ncbi:MAG TPA: universal stress protein [Rhizomicrobium sp.]|nr:universal stress protein [Rhizomicrobium sp.]